MEKQTKIRRICFIVSMLALWGIFCFPMCGWTETLLDKNFEDGDLPEGWIPSGDWNVQNTANYTEGSGYCVQNAGASISSPDTLQLPVIDFSDYSSVYLYFSTYFEQMQESKTIRIEISTDGGSSWISTGWEQSGTSYMGTEAVELSSWFDGCSIGTVRFVFTDNDGFPDSGSIWQIDDVSLEAAASPGNTISGIVWDGTQGISGVIVEAYNWENPEGMDYFSTETDESGNYFLHVYDGDWEVGIILPNAAWITPQPQTVTVGGAIHSVEVSFLLDKTPDGFVSGQILSPAGTALTSTESPNYGVYIDAVNTENGYWYSANPDNQGNYSIPLMSGIYDISVWVDPGIYPDYTAPIVNEPIRLTSGTVPMNIQLLSENCKIAGTVKVSETGIPGVFVDVWNESGDWRYDITDQNGYFEVPVYPGTWYVSPCTWGTDTVMFMDPPQEKTVASGQTVTADFNMTQASQPITGVIKDETGTVLTVIDAWVYAREEGSPNPVAETWVENGEFLLNVPPGTYKVGLYLWPDSGYSFDPASDEQSITQARSKRMAAEISTTAGAAILELSGQEKSLAAPSGKDKRSGEPLVFTLKSNTKKIKGFFKDSQGAAITGLSGYVFADRVLQSGEISVSSLAWHMAEINSQTGGFEIPVSAGTWALSYSLFSVPEIFPYRELTEPILVTVAEADQTKTQDIKLPPLGSDQLCGTVYYPDGTTPASNIIVWLRSSELDIKDGNFMEYQTRSDETGNFCFSLPSDISQSLSVGMAVKPMDVPGVGRGSSRGNGGRSQVISWPRTKRANDLKLVLREINMEIKGRVMRPGGTEAAEGAFVYAYSADGQKSDATADSNGSFILEAARAESSRGNIWRVGAIFKSPDGSYSRTKEILCNTSDTAQSAFAVGDMVLGSGKIMMDSVTHTFLPGKGWSHTLADGTGIQIPDGAIPADAGKEVKISVEPLVRDLPNTTEDRVVGYGYGITLREKENGREIVKKFSKNVTVILRYTDELLTELGIREADLRPAYFLNASRSWKPLKNFTIDTAANKVTFRTDHFSTWALVAKNGFLEPGNVNGSNETNDGVTLSDVTLSDAILSLQICAGATIPEGVQIFREAAVNGDSKIGPEEAVYILQKVANLR
ncbi:MAG: hypothetical protein AB7S75_23755 [Desulfococcaceae bacterium]